ncbi:hypothetical protein [Subtercola sp. RTI3]|uniref:hypothetical protein n=1 Tax=Subtercola sp. RTI3 TaxID=3048639 RepID=UPI002B232BCC|nr:hypothetical protein [Subtercola sp. RTI3]MEA9986005.1 hypothetical protein [Subtercola sp. RTI3]
MTASLSRRQLRQRESIASVEPLIETRRERRDRELAAAMASSIGAEMAATAAASVPEVVAPAVPDARRRDRRAAVTSDVPIVATTPVVATPVDVATVAAMPVVSTPVAAKPVAATPVIAPAPAVVASPAESVTQPEPFVEHTTVSSLTFSRLDGASEPRGAAAAVSTAGRRVLPRMRHRASIDRPHSRRRGIVNTVVMFATAGLVATLALPAYAYSDSNSVNNPNLAASSQLGIQSLTVAGVNGQQSVRDSYTTTGDLAAMDSTQGSTVSPTVQALAAELMVDVASGKLVGSVPDHIQEIRNLANGVAVKGCGVDYRILQVIKVVVDNFDKVGVSDINRLCTGQIEGAGTASSHYKDGGGHAVDFYILNGHGLTGADADSIKLIKLLDPLVPPGTGLGQSECGRSISTTNFVAFQDTCTHDHIDFGNAKGLSLKL